MVRFISGSGLPYVQPSYMVFLPEMKDEFFPEIKGDKCLQVKGIFF